MIIEVLVENAVWECEFDEDDKEHPEEFHCYPDIPGHVSLVDKLAVDAEIHDYLRLNCDCGLIEGDFHWAQEVTMGK